MEKKIRSNLYTATNGYKKTFGVPALKVAEIQDIEKNINDPNHLKIIRLIDFLHS